MNLYEGMFLLDNQVVREDWKTAKEIVTATLEKHGATVHTARRWDERKLAYPIKRKKRATFLLAYYEVEGGAMPALRRDLDLNERVLRYLNLAVDGVPEGEAELAAAENAADFRVPEPPADDAPEERFSVSAGEESLAEEDESEDGTGDEARDSGEVAPEARRAQRDGAEADVEEPVETGKEG